MRQSNTFTDFDISDEVIVVTGSGGKLGSSYCELFLSLGARVVGLDVRQSSSHAYFVDEYSERYLFCQANVTNKQEVIASAEKIHRKFSKTTVLINNAAIDSPPGASVSENGPFESYPESSWDSVMAVNLKGVMLASQIFGDVMATNGGGSIINISSIYGMLSPDQSLYEYRRKNGDEFFKPVAYSVSKAGILNLTRYLAVYWAKKNVRVNTLTLAGVADNQDVEFLQGYNNRIPIGRMAEPRDYFGAIVFLASGASRYMTGSNLVVDGGWTAI